MKAVVRRDAPLEVKSLVAPEPGPGEPLEMEDESANFAFQSAGTVSY